MQSGVWLYATGLAASAILAFGCLLLVWSRNLESQARGPLMVAIAVLAAGSFLYTVAPNDAVAWYFFSARMSAITLIGPLILLQALHYRGWTTWTEGWRLAVFLAIPAVTICLIWTAPRLVTVATGATVIHGIRIPLGFDWGPWFPVHSAYGYSTMLGGIALYRRFAAESLARYRAQTILAIAIVGAALLSSIFSTFAPSLLDLRWDLTSLSFIGIAPMLYWFFGAYEGSDLRLVARQALLDEIGSAVVVIDDRRRVLDSNRAFELLADLAATNPLPALTDESRLPPVGTGPSTWDVSVEVASQARNFEVHATALGEGRLAVEGWLILAHDVTERALLVEELESYDRMVAHDLRNPLIGGVSLLDLADMRAGPGNLPPEIGQARQAFARALDIIKAHLRLARFRADHELLARPLDMGNIVASVVEELRWQISQADARIEITKSWPSAIGDAALIGQVWSNYISNAIRHGGQPPRIEIGGELVDRHFARFWVENEDRPSEAASGEPAGREDSTAGLGMGLKIVHRIIERSGGALGIHQANDGRRVRYWFTLPAGTRERQRPVPT